MRDEIRSTLQPGSKGKWEIIRFEVSKGDAKFFNLGQMINGRSRFIEPGIYTKLTRNGLVIMSDTPAEVSDLYELRWQAKGKVLILGLGLGVATEICLNKEDVSEVVVVEIDQEVIDLVGTQLFKKYGDDRLKIICADAVAWKSPRGERYDVVWHDIWDNICADNMDEIRLLRRRYGQKSNWQGTWAYEEHRNLCYSGR